MSEGEPKLEEEKPKEIKDAENFDELYEILRKRGEIKGKENTVYKADYLIESIEVLRKKFKDYDKTVIVSGLDLNLSKFASTVTRSEGVREKVKELLLKRK